MEIIFDRELAGSYGDPNDELNTPKLLIQRVEDMLRSLGEFVNADSIEYIDADKIEIYEITRNGERYQLIAAGNSFDGGWLDFRKVEYNGK